MHKEKEEEEIILVLGFNCLSLCVWESFRPSPDLKRLSCTIHQNLHSGVNCVSCQDLIDLEPSL